MCSVTKASGGKVTERNLRPCYKVSCFHVLLFLLHKFFTEEKGGKKETRCMVAKALLLEIIYVLFISDHKSIHGACFGSMNNAFYIDFVLVC